jgi:hypothetical protein
MKKSDAFPSKWITAADLYGRPMIVKVKSVEMCELKSPDGKTQNKPVARFHNQEKGLVLNKVNFDTIADILGADTDDWSGGEIELYPDKTHMGGKQVDCVRVRPPADVQPVQQPTRRPVAKPPKGALPPVGEDMSDEIPAHLR